MYILNILLGTLVIAVPVSPTTNGIACTSTGWIQEELSKEEKESGFYDEEGYVVDTEERPAINPNFDPDEDCDLAYELKCITGSQQKCAEGFNNFENNVCSPIGCQEGYHDVYDDESGLCYPNEEGCPDYDDFVLIEEENGVSCVPE